MSPTVLEIHSNVGSPPFFFLANFIFFCGNLFVLKDRKHANFRFESLSDTKSKRNFDSRKKKPAKICFAK
jgi:hypothetical protein